MAITPLLHISAETYVSSDQTVKVISDNDDPECSGDFWAHVHSSTDAKMVRHDPGRTIAIRPRFFDSRGHAAYYIKPVFYDRRERTIVLVCPHDGFNFYLKELVKVASRANGSWREAVSEGAHQDWWEKVVENWINHGITCQVQEGHEIIFRSGQLEATNGRDTR